MIIHRESKSSNDIINTLFLDEENNVILEFEDKSHYLGTKIAVYNGLGDPIYLIDDTSTGNRTELSILQGSKQAATLQIADNFFSSYNVSISAATGKYEFHFMHRALEKNGVPIAIIKPHPIKIEKLLDEGNEPSDAPDIASEKIERANSGIIKLLRKGGVSLLNHIEFDITADNSDSLNLYLTMLYVIQFLVVNKITSIIK